VKTIGIDELAVDPHNRRSHPERNVAMLVDSLQRVGAARSIVIDERNGILAGNGLIEAARRAGKTRVMVVEADGDAVVAVRRRGLSDADKRALALYDNRASELAEWNTAELAADLTRGDDLAPFFTADELAAMLGPRTTGGRTDPDDVPEPTATNIREGDMFALGAHRVLCGDSTRVEVVTRVLDGAQPDLVFTDPPYGVNITGKGGDAIAGDISFTAIPLMFDVIDRVLAPDAWIYVCGGQSNMALYSRLMERYFRQLPRVVVWDKGNTAVLRRNGYHSCYEFIYYTFREGGGGRWFAPRDSEHADDIWRVRVERGEARKHLTQKPVAIPRRAIENSCPPDGLIFDPFGGSGSTLIAAEATARRCAIMEIDPTWCQVMIDRWQAFTGKTAEKLG